VLNIQPSDVMTAAEYDFKQSAVSVTISERERLQNSGKERMISLLERRIGNAERTFMNNLSADLYSDGTADGGKQVGGLAAAISTDPDANSVYGGINPSTWNFWRNQQETAALATASTKIRPSMMKLWLKCVRNMDKPDLIVADNNAFEKYWSELQDQQRFTNPDMGKMGFTNIRFLNAEVVLDGGVGGNAPVNRMYFLNCDYIHWRPNKDANMVPLNPDRFATNQAAMVKLIHWMGNLTVSNRELQGVLNSSN